MVCRFERIRTDAKSVHGLKHPESSVVLNMSASGELYNPRAEQYPRAMVV
jgi:hypothetical protein